MRDMDHIIISSQWEIEPFFGLQALAKYSHELDLLASGVSLSELKFSEQRSELEPYVIGSEVRNRSSLSDTDLPAKSIAKLSLSGVMRMEDGLSSRGVQQLINDIRTADSNPSIGAILLQVNSGGGEVTAGTELKNALDDVIRNGSTLIGVYAQLCGSAAVRATLPAHFIYANNESAHIGSIGTMATINKEMLKYAKKNLVDVYAKPSTKKNKEYRALLKNDFKPLIDMLTQSNQHFIDDVQKYRNITGSKSEVSDVLSGALLTADVALERGLIDGIGTFGQAVEKLQDLMSEASPEIGTFYNSNKGKMNLTSFITALVPGLNSLLGTEIKSDSTADVVLEAINSATSLEDRVATMKAELAETQKADLETMKAELEASQKASMDEMEGKLTSLNEKVSGLEAEKETLATEKAELATQIAEMEAKKIEMDTASKALEVELAELKGKAKPAADDGTQAAANSSAPTIEDFATVNTFNQLVKPKGGSKY